MILGIMHQYMETTNFREGLLTSKAISGIEFRANNIESLENLEENSIDFYASVRSLYLQDRENKIKNNQRGNIDVIYEDDEDWEEMETNNQR